MFFQSLHQQKPVVFTSLIIDFVFKITASHHFVEINFHFCVQFVVFGVFLQMVWHVLLVDTDIIQTQNIAKDVSLIKTIELAAHKRENT